MNIVSLTVDEGLDGEGQTNDEIWLIIGEGRWENAKIKR